MDDSTLADIEANLNLFRYLFEVLMAQEAASHPRGQSQLGDLRARVESAIRFETQSAAAQAPDLEWQVDQAARMLGLAARLFARAEVRRAALARKHFGDPS